MSTDLLRRISRHRDWCEVDYKTAPPDQRESAKLRLIQANLALEAALAPLNASVHIDGNIPEPKWVSRFRKRRRAA